MPINGREPKSWFESQEDLKKEFSLLQKDIMRFKSGALLWIEDKYPNAIRLHPLYKILFSKLDFPPNMKEVVDEYYKLLDHCKENCPELYEMEMKESKSLVFEKTIQPMNILVEKNASVKYLNKQLVKQAKIVKKYQESLIKSPQKLQSRDGVIEQEMKEMLKESAELKEIFGKMYLKDEKAKVYRFLRLIKDIDSFHIIFVKFLERMYFILKRDNRDYENTKKSYIMVNPKVYDPKTRDKLKSFLKQELSQKFPLLSNYSLTIFKYNKFRLLEAHDNPKLTISNGIAFIEKPGTSKVIEMNLEEVGRVIQTYSYFIRALNFY